MIRTIKWYLTKDLAKATGLATVVFTLVVSVFAIIEPLRDRGLSGIQAMKLFGYSMPVMFSLTLPIAALFAATFVYGRFSQDNELMACRASGISMVSLLVPAVWLGMIVSLTTLGLGLYVAPRLLWQSQYMIRQDLEHIVFHGLKSQRQVTLGSNRIFHADQVDPDNHGLGGVIALDTSKNDDALVMAASQAYLEFSQDKGDAFVLFHPDNPVVFRQDAGTVAREESEGIRKTQLEDIFQDEPKLYDATRLLKVLDDPREFPRVQTEMEKIERQIVLQKFLNDIATSVTATGRYDKLMGLANGKPDPNFHIEIQAKYADTPAGKEVRLFANRAASSQAATGPASQPAETSVVVGIYRGKDLELEMHAASVNISCAWEDTQSQPRVSVVLRQAVVTFSTTFREIGGRHDSYTPGAFAVPMAFLSEGKIAGLDDLLYGQPEKYALSKPLENMIKNLKGSVVRGLLLKVQAELHLRLAYGVSCLFMVMLGAALGMLLKGGQALAAFAISAVPASLVIMLLFMGKELMKNDKVPHSVMYGSIAMWGGIVALAAATLYVYIVPVRR